MKGFKEEVKFLSRKLEGRKASRVVGSSIKRRPSSTNVEEEEGWGGGGGGGGGGWGLGVGCGLGGGLGALVLLGTGME